ncbi:MAG: winged helix-turn-helix transcriptional regulator [Candidatus Rokuibacteriota bacterium]
MDPVNQAPSGAYAPEGDRRQRGNAVTKRAGSSGSDESLRIVEDVLGCKWTVQILAAIGDGARRPGRIRRTVVGISTKVMNERLGKLVGFGVLERRALSLMPPHVEYHLTPRGRQLDELIEHVQHFCAQWDAPTSPGDARRPTRPPRTPPSPRISRGSSRGSRRPRAGAPSDRSRSRSA